MSRDSAIANQISMGARPSANLAAPNTIFPQRPNYSRPPRPDDLQAKSVSAAALAFDGEPVEAADSAIQNATKAFESHLASIPVDRYSPDGLKDQITGFAETDAFKAVAPAVQKVTDLADAATAHVEQVKAALSPDGDTAAELRASRYWARTSRNLDSDSGAQLLSAAADLVRDATPAERGTLLQELPAYLQSRGQASTDWLDSVVLQTVPELTNAQQAASLAAKARDVTHFNAKMLNDRVTQTDTPSRYRRPNYVPTTAVR